MLLVGGVHFVTHIIMNETDKAYIAGFIDGEGSIGLRACHSSRGYTYDSYLIRIKVAQTNEDVLQWIKTMTGVGSVRQRKDVPGYRRAWEWYLAGRNALKVLHEIYPYLRVKRIQAEIAFEFEKTYVGKGYRLTLEQHGTRSELREKMDCANHRED